jgi:hypothetical protein
LPKVSSKKANEAGNMSPTTVGYFHSHQLANNLPSLLGKDYLSVFGTLGKPISVKEIPASFEKNLEYKMLLDHTTQSNLRASSSVPVHIRITHNSLATIAIEYCKATKNDYPYANLPIPVIQAIGTVESMSFFSTHRTGEVKCDNSARDDRWRRISSNIFKLQNADEHEIERLLGPAEYTFYCRDTDGTYCFQMAYYPYKILSDSTLTAEGVIIRFAHNRPQSINIFKCVNAQIYY